MTELISHFRLFRGDLTASVLTDGQVENLFDINRRWLDRVPLAHDSDFKIYSSDFKFIESDASIIASDGSVVIPSASHFIEGIFEFATPQNAEYWLKGYHHNLYLTVALAYRMVIDGDDLWETYRRGDVSLSKRDARRLAEWYERMGFVRQPSRTIRRG